MRKVIWNWLREKTPEGAILPWWALAIRAALFPIDFFYLRMSRKSGYQWESDIWLIEGIRYSGVALRCLSQADGEIYRIRRTGDVVTMEKVLVPK